MEYGRLGFGTGASGTFGAAGEVLLRAVRLWKNYGGRPALRGLELEVRRGEVCGLLGTNGAGKTTFLRLVAGLLHPSSGEIEVLGFPQGLFPYKARKLIGYMPDSPGMPERITVLEYLELYALLSDTPADGRRERVEAALTEVGLADRWDVEIAALSRGMLQRLALGRLLLRPAELLLLDEPLAGLDPRGRVEMLRLLQMLARGGATVLISSHVLSDMERFCDRVAILEEGRLRFAGTVAQALAAVTGPPRYRAVVGGEAERAAACLGETPGCYDVAVEADERGRGIGFTLLGRAPDPAVAAERLVAGGFRLLGLSRVEPTLADAFLHFTEGRVA